MLAVFDQSVAKSLEGLSSQSSVSESSALKDGLLIQDLYSLLHPNSVTINLGLPGFIAYSSHKQSPLLPRSKRRGQYLLHLCLYFDRRSTLQLLTSGLLVVLLLNYFFDRTINGVKKNPNESRREGYWGQIESTS
ncbi:unnamed protein product [Camellia sinensis]